MMSSRFLSRPRPLRPEPPLLSTRWLLFAIAGSALIVGILLHNANLSISATPAALGFAVYAVVATAAYVGLRRPASPIQMIARDMIEGVSLFGLVSLLGAIASYPLAAGHHPLVDTELEHADLVLHFHWLSWYEWVAVHDWVQWPERLAYLSIFVTPAALIGYFSWAGRRAESRLFVATYWTAVFITLSAFPLFPAAGPFSTLWRGSAPYMPLSAYYQDQVIVALRQHTIHSIDLGALHGLVCAPSFHAASGVIYITTALRVRQLRWPLVALNALMLMATPVEGTHYLTDLLAGVIVAGAALWLTPQMVRLAERADIIWPRRLGGLTPVAAE